MINFSEYKQSLVSIFDPECYEILLYHQFIMCMHGGQMIIWGLWGAEIFSLFATFLSVDIMAAQTVCNSLMLMFTMVGIGIVQSTTIIIGNMVGARKINAAILYGKVSLLAAGLWGLLTCSILLLFEDFLIRVYNQSANVN